MKTSRDYVTFVLDAAGLVCLGAAAFTWCLGAGLVTAGISLLAFNWRLEQKG